MAPPTIFLREVLAAVVLCSALAAQQPPPAFFFHHKGAIVPLVPSKKYLARQLRGGALPEKYSTLKKMASEGLSSLNQAGDRLFVVPREAMSPELKQDLDIGLSTSELLDLGVFELDRELAIVQPQVIVQFKRGTAASANRALLQKFSSRITTLPGYEVYLMSLENRVSTLKVADILYNNVTVRYSEPNLATFRERSRALALDGSLAPCAMGASPPPISLQWSFKNPGTPGKQGADIRLFPAWTQTTGSPDIHVAVMDDGVDFSHPALRGRNAGEWDAVNDSPAVSLQPTDTHGTRVAGIIAAEPAVAGGVSGVAPKVKLLGIRMGSRNAFLNFTETATTLKAIGKARELNADIMNFSVDFVSTDTVDQALTDAMNEGRVVDGAAKGMVIVAAAGNDGGDLLYPASLAASPSSSLIAVAASNQWDQLKSFHSKDAETDWASNNGAGATVAAPGVRIVTTAPNLGPGSALYDCGFRGTSGAAPHVSGVAALMLSVDRNLSAGDVKSRIAANSDPLTDDANTLLKLGRVNACRALLLAHCN